MNPLVSIVCITYNHEAYIADAIEGFLMQKTDFEYEILIGEDKSTDNTLQVIKSYMEKYPGRITLITSRENVGADENEQRLIRCAKGKYIAFCEGDDYWTEPYKLQKQIDYLEEHPKCTICFHNAEVVDYMKKPIGKLHVPYLKSFNKYYYGKDSRYDAGQLAVLHFIPTASMTIRKESMSNLPDFYYDAIVTDLPIRLIVASRGYAYYMDNVMSAYRYNVPGSQTQVGMERAKARETNITDCKRFLSLIDEFDAFTHFKYTKDLQRTKMHWLIPLAFAENRIDELKHSPYKEYFEEVGFVEKSKVYIKYLTPNLYNRIKLIYQYIKSKKINYKG